MNEYLRAGNDEGIMAASKDGGYPLPAEMYGKTLSHLTSKNPLRTVVGLVSCEATTYDILADGADGVDRISIPLHELSALTKASQRLLDDSAFDVEDWLAGRIADKFARSEASAFVNGDGVDKPRGFLTAPQVENDVWEWGSLGCVLTGVDGGLGGTDSLIDLVYALGAEYRASASFVMNSKTAGAVRKTKDDDGRFLWSDGLAAGEPSRLLGYAVLIADDMPDVAPDATAIAFGDFGAGYTVAERPDLRVLRDPFSAKPHVLFYATKRVGGDVSDFAAIKLLKFSRPTPKEPKA